MTEPDLEARVALLEQKFAAMENVLYSIEKIINNVLGNITK